MSKSPNDKKNIERQAKLRPVLKFTKVDDASQLAQVTQNAVVTVISWIEK